MPRNMGKETTLGKLGIGVYFRFYKGIGVYTAEVYQRVACSSPGMAEGTNWFYGVQYQPSEDSNSVHFINVSTGELWRGKVDMKVVEDTNVMLLSRIDTIDRIR